jgi:uncharacterized protein YjiS (DUF1127 family)
MSVLLDTLMMRRTRRRHTTDFRQLDAHLLRDIGLDGYDFNRMVTGRDFARLQDRRR